MKKDDFYIGLEFYTGSGKWRCTDIGTRVITAIKLDHTDESWFNGPPYAVDESVFDEYGFDGCSFDSGDFVEAKREEHQPDRQSR